MFVHWMIHHSVVMIDHRKIAIVEIAICVVSVVTRCRKKRVRSANNASESSISISTENLRSKEMGSALLRN